MSFINERGDLSLQFKAKYYLEWIIKKYNCKCKFSDHLLNVTSEPRYQYYICISWWGLERSFSNYYYDNDHKAERPIPFPK